MTHRTQTLHEGHCLSEDKTLVYVIITCGSYTFRWKRVDSTRIDTRGSSSGGRPDSLIIGCKYDPWLLLAECRGVTEQGTLTAPDEHAVASHG